MKTWLKMWNCIRKPWILNVADDPGEVDDIKLIQAAGEEVSAARAIYAQVDDPDMVDWAVYQLTAAEKRYDFLLKKYRQKQ